MYLVRQRQNDLWSIQEGRPQCRTQVECQSNRVTTSDCIARTPVPKARDLRKIDSRVPNLVPTILVRKEAILVC